MWTRRFYSTAGQRLEGAMNHTRVPNVSIPAYSKMFADQMNAIPRRFSNRAYGLPKA